MTDTTGPEDRADVIERHARRDTPTLPAPAAWMRRLRFSSVHGAIPQWEACFGREATGHFERQPGYEYRPLYTATALQEALDRAERAEAAIHAARDAHLSIVGEYEDRATTAEAALDSARKVIIRQDKALKPMSSAIYNDNGDMTISGCHPTPDECVNAYWAERSARQWLSANPAKETPNAE